MENDTLFQRISRDGHAKRLLDNDVLTIVMHGEPDPTPVRVRMLSGAFYLLLVMDGIAALSVNYRTRAIGPRSLAFLTPSMVVALERVDAGFRAVGLAMAPDFFDSLPTNAHVCNQLIAHMAEFGSPVLELDEAESDAVRRTIDLYDTIGDVQLHRNGMVRYLTDFLMLKVAAALRLRGSVRTGRMAHSVELYHRFRQLLAEHYREEHGIAFYAGQLCVSTAYLSRIVRQVSHNTVNGHIATVLLIEARYWLDSTDRPVKQIADDLRFSDQAAFGKFFKKQMGLSPLAYRHRSERPARQNQ